MCGRVTLDLDLELIEEILSGAFNVKNTNISQYSKSYNIAPSMDLLTVINDGKNNRGGFLKWGLVPSFSKDPALNSKLFNARIETCDKKPAFKESFFKKRCVIIVSSFYEWNHYATNNTPYRVVLKDKPVMYMAGLWSVNKHIQSNPLYTCTILTQPANKKISLIHNRMPVILDRYSALDWLNHSNCNPYKLKNSIPPLEDACIGMYPVSKLVNNVSYDSQQLILPLD